MYKEFDKVEIQVDGAAIYKGEVNSVKGESVFVRRTNLDGSMPVIMEYNIHDPQLALIKEKPVETPAPTPDPVVPETPEPAASNEEPAAEEQKEAETATEQVEVPSEEVKDETPAASNEEPA